MKRYVLLVIKSMLLEYPDVAKVLGCVTHEILQSKLSSYGIQGIVR
jgi:hypothetical protein